MDGHGANAVPAPEQAAARLHNPAEIAQILVRLLDQRGLISVHVIGSAGSHSSVLLELDLHGGSLLLDELHPPAANRQLAPGARLLVNARLEGSRIEFTCTVRDAVHLRGGPAWRVAMPESIDYFERRSGYRLTVPAGMHLQPAILNGLDGPISARLLDVSRRGMAAILGSAVQAEIGIHVPCSLRLLENRLDLDAEIRSSVLQHNQLRVGMMFMNMTPAQRTALDTSVARLERNLLRHYAAAKQR
ncbi:MAG: flagellar brake protein [Nevskiaceae bacterium]|nr:MAG: flagellar brake protein [Nevskiaceae bacterium]